MSDFHVIDNNEVVDKADAWDAISEKNQQIATLTARVAELESESIAHPAECYPGCEDPHCPYTHQSVTWEEECATLSARIEKLEEALRELSGEWITMRVGVRKTLLDHCREELNRRRDIAAAALKTEGQPQ